MPLGRCTGVAPIVFGKDIPPHGVSVPPEGLRLPRRLCQLRDQPSYLVFIELEDGVPLPCLFGNDHRHAVRGIGVATDPHVTSEVGRRYDNTVTPQLERVVFVFDRIVQGLDRVRRCLPGACEQPESNTDGDAAAHDLLRRPRLTTLAAAGCGASKARRATASAWSRM